MRLRGHTKPEPINYSTESWRSALPDAYTESLNYGIPSSIKRAASPYTLNNYTNLVDPGIVNTSRGYYGIGNNWPQVAPLFGASQRTEPAPVVLYGGKNKTGAPNTNRWSTNSLQAYLNARMQSASIYSATGVTANAG